MKEYKMKINGTDYAVTVNEGEDSILEVEVNGTPFKVEMEKAVKKTVEVKKPTATTAAPAVKVNKPAAAGGAGTTVSSPMGFMDLHKTCILVRGISKGIFLDARKDKYPFGWKHKGQMK